MIREEPEKIQKKKICQSPFEFSRKKKLKGHPPGGKKIKKALMRKQI